VSKHNSSQNEEIGTAGQNGYAPINGLEMYYEIHGATDSSRPPLVLLHGGGDTIRTSFSHLLPALARDRQVVAFEQQGFGHTADIADRPFSFVQSADDTAALLEYLQIGQADLFGFSNGGTIALQVAIRHPQMVRKLVAASGFYQREGSSYSWFWEGFPHARLENMPEELREAYLEVAPQPENLQNFFDKCVARMRNFADIPAEAMRGITAPTLVIVGDSDVMRPEHAVEIFRLLPHAQLAVLPGTDHMALMKRASWLVPMVGEFLNAAAIDMKQNPQRPENSDSHGG
jgi:pimeloyl-ACP methyl ester carboxylesterase